MELGWPWNILIIVVFAAPSNLQWEGQEKIWVSLASCDLLTIENSFIFVTCI